MWSEAVKVHPWIGKFYESPVNLRHKTLVLGESNFTSPEKFKSDLVINCVEDDVSADPSDTSGFCRFSTKIRRTIFGVEESIGPVGFWQDVAFYNFVQFLVGDESRIRPTQEMWNESIPAFTEIISVLQPSRILVLGQANWKNLVHHVENTPIDTFSSKLKVGTTEPIAGYINHPSSSLSYATWRPIASRLLLE
jgi:hypothetical protein